MRVKLARIFIYIVACALVIGEIGTRLLYPQPTYGALLDAETLFIACPDSPLPFCMRPNTTATMTATDGAAFRYTFTTNTGGWRVVEQQGTGSRVAMVGDSFVFGMGLNQGGTYPDAVARCTGHTVRNYGMSATGLDTYYVIMDQLLPAYDPDVVIVTIYLGNDVHDLATTTWPQTTPDGYPLQIKYVNGVVLGDRQLLSVNAAPYRTPWLRDFHLWHFAHRAYAQLTRRSAPPDTRTALRLIDGMRALAAAHGWRLVLVTVPDAQEGYTLPLDDALHLPLFADDHYLVAGGHWNARGARAAAEAVCEVVAE